ncbi:hypothetical protein U4960_04565 [Altererythrobacter sp. H2]|uniref:hypothetical protein n=1 Tax=Altererythrobacter sp. H2 TaxID=3108391 RepID=UPI002B4BBE21|nr:hypothetical protein [Altererythrobacter sp. H2]WRK96601.1 hypothetical protein U4960_04565 [Altererythrobacter sp. H2]
MNDQDDPHLAEPPTLADAIEEHRAREAFGITTNSAGTWLPEASYRPVPIVWFAAAWFMQMFMLAVLYLLLASEAAILTAGATALSSWLIGRWTWARGMAQAGRGWRAVTIGALAFAWAWTALLAFASR